MYRLSDMFLKKESVILKYIKVLSSCLRNDETSSTLYL
jgi:hypothetical protein